MTPEDEWLECGRLSAGLDMNRLRIMLCTLQYQFTGWQIKSSQRDGEGFKDAKGRLVHAEKCSGRGRRTPRGSLRPCREGAPHFARGRRHPCPYARPSFGFSKCQSKRAYGCHPKKSSICDSLKPQTVSAMDAYFCQHFLLSKPIYAKACKPSNDCR